MCYYTNNCNSEIEVNHNDQLKCLKSTNDTNISKHNIQPKYHPTPYKLLQYISCFTTAVNYSKIKPKKRQKFHSNNNSKHKIIQYSFFQKYEKKNIL